MGRPTRQARVAEIRAAVVERGAASIDEALFAELCERLAPLKPDTVRKFVRDSGVPLAPMVEGVRQDSFDDLERTLTSLANEYEAAPDRERRRTLRRVVITAKDHARFAARRAADQTKRRDKEEMIEWMLVWLENPPVFPQWAALRHRARFR